MAKKMENYTAERTVTVWQGEELDFPESAYVLAYDPTIIKDDTGTFDIRQNGETIVLNKDGAKELVKLINQALKP